MVAVLGCGCPRLALGSSRGLSMLRLGVSRSLSSARPVALPGHKARSAQHPHLAPFALIPSCDPTQAPLPRPLHSSARWSAPVSACAAHGHQQDAGEPFTVTTPLYYVNAAPHMGSAYPTIAADSLARYVCRRFIDRWYRPVPLPRPGQIPLPRKRDARGQHCRPAAAADTTDAHAKSAPACLEIRCCRHYRFYRMMGRRVRFVTGTDEHGEKIALAAEKRGMSPKGETRCSCRAGAGGRGPCRRQSLLPLLCSDSPGSACLWYCPAEHCDDIVRSYQSLWSSLDIEYDSFIRTTDPNHEKLVAEVLDKVRGNQPCIGPPLPLPADRLCCCPV